MDQGAQISLLLLRVPADANALLTAIQNMGDKRPASASLDLIQTITEYTALRLALTDKDSLIKAYTLALPLAKQLPWACKEFKELISQHSHHWKFETIDTTGEATTFAEPLAIDVINILYNIGVLHVREAFGLANKEDAVRLFAEAANLFEHASEMSKDILPIGDASGCDFLDSNYLLAISHTIRGYGYEYCANSQISAKAAPALIAQNVVKAYRSFDRSLTYFSRLSEGTDFYYSLWYFANFKQHYYEVASRYYISQSSTPDNALKESIEAISLLEKLPERLTKLESLPVHAEVKHSYEELKKLVGVAGKKKPTAAAQLQDLNRLTHTLSDRADYTFELPHIYIPSAGRVMSEYTDADALQLKVIELDNKVAELRRIRDTQNEEIRQLKLEFENAQAQPRLQVEEAHKEEVVDSKGKKNAKKESNKTSTKSSRRGSVKIDPASELNHADPNSMQMPVLAERVLALAAESPLDFSSLLKERTVEIERLQNLCMKLADQGHARPEPVAIPILSLPKQESRTHSTAPSIPSSARGKSARAEKSKKGKKKGENSESSDAHIAETPVDSQKPVPVEPMPAQISHLEEEVAALKVELQERDTEIAKLKDQLGTIAATPVAQPANPPSTPQSARGKPAKVKPEKPKKTKGKRGEASENSESTASATASQIMSDNTSPQAPVPAKPSEVLSTENITEVYTALEQELATIRAKNVELEAQLITAQSRNAQPDHTEAAEQNKIYDSLALKEAEIEKLRTQLAKLEEQTLAQTRNTLSDSVNYEKLFREREKEVEQIRKLLVSRDLEINRLKSTPGSDSVLCIQKTEIERLRGELRARDNTIERLKRSVSSQEEAFTCLRNTVQEKDKETFNLRMAIKAQDQQMRSLLNTATYNASPDATKYLPSSNPTSLETVSRTELDNLRAELREKNREIAKLREAFMNSCDQSMLDSTFQAELDHLRKELQNRDKTIAALTMRINAMDIDTL